MMSIPIAQLQQFLNPNHEPFYPEYLEHLRRINQIVHELGEPLEGNLFYLDQDPELSDRPCQAFLSKRRALAMFAMTRSNILEIGFNAGHSALLMLAANPNVSVTSVDTCYHTYSRPCFEYLQSIFGSRISLIAQQSSDIWRGLDAGKFDGYHVDGGHDLVTAGMDMDNCINRGSHGSVILFDDSDGTELRLMLNFYMLSGRVINISDTLGHLPNIKQMFFINNR